MVKTVLKLKYDERPPYEYILNTLKQAFFESIVEKVPQSMPSVMSDSKNQAKI